MTEEELLKTGVDPEVVAIAKLVHQLSRESKIKFIEYLAELTGKTDTRKVVKE